MTLLCNRQIDGFQISFVIAEAVPGTNRGQFPDASASLNFGG
jgi:hypothetical protein